MTLPEVLAELKRQSDWRGPSGRMQGHVVLPGEQARFLHAAVLSLIAERDELLKALAATTTEEPPK